MSYIVCQVVGGVMTHGWRLPFNLPGDPCCCGEALRGCDACKRADGLHLWWCTRAR